MYYTLCFSPCFCRLQLSSMLFFHYAFPTAKIPNPTVTTAPYFQQFSLLHWLLLCYQLFLLHVLPVVHYPLPFSVAVLLSSPSSGQDDRLTETNALHRSYIHGKGWLSNAQTLTAGLKDVSYLVDLLQSSLSCRWLLEHMNYGWHENELWGAMSWEAVKGGTLSSLKWDFSLILWLVSVPEAWDAFLWGGGMSGEDGGSEDSSGVSLEFVLLKRRTQWDGVMDMSWEVISQARSFLRAIMSWGFVIASQPSSPWSLNQSLEEKSAKNLSGEICSKGSGC